MASSEIVKLCRSYISLSTLHHWGFMLQASVFSSISTSSLSEGLLVCLGRLESHMTTCGGQYLLQDAVSLADIVVWATLYVVLAPEAATSQSISFYPAMIIKGRSQVKMGVANETKLWLNVQFVGVVNQMDILFSVLYFKSSFMITRYYQGVSPCE